jgi:polar amino acid transport system substrate-binding protein
MLSPQKITRFLPLVLAIWISVLAPLWAEPTLRVRADTWMPFNGEPTGERPGYVVELARMIFEPAGIKVDYQLMPWKESLAAARNGEIEAVIGANPTEAAGLTIPRGAIGMPRVALFVKKENPWKYQNIQSLNAVRLGAITGYSYWDSLDEFLKTNRSGKVTFFGGETPLDDGIAQLKSGKIDVMAETLAVFIWTVRSQGGSPSDYRVAYLQAGEPIYMAFSKTDTGIQYAKIFDEGLVRLRKSGELANVLKKYGLSDWE